MTERDSGGGADAVEPVTEVSLADAEDDRQRASGDDSIAGQMAARIDAAPSVPGDALDWATIASGYEREALARTDDSAAAATLLYEAGRIFEERLGSAGDALALHRRAFEKDPAFRPNLLAARRLATHLGDDALVVDLLAAEERIAEDDEVRAELLAHRVRWLLALGRTDEAAVALHGVEPSPSAAFSLADVSATLAATTGDPAGLAEAWARCAETTKDGALSPQFQGAAATLVEEALGQRERAAGLYLQAFSRRPQDPFLRAAARRQAECAGQWEQFAALLRTEAEEATGREAASAWGLAAWVEQGRLGRLQAAIECLQRGAQAAPQSPEILRALSRAQESAGNAAGEAEALAALAELFASRGAPAERKEAVDVLLRLATIEEVRQRLPEAVAACREALALVPGEQAILSHLGRLCARTGDFEGVAGAYLAEAEATPDAGDRGRLLLRAAEVLEARLGRPEEAVRRYGEALAADANLLAARDALERLHTRAGNWREVVALLDVELGGLHSPRERVAHLFRMAQIQEERLVDLAGAAESWRRLLSIEPEHLLALRAFGRCLEGLGRWEDLAEVLQKEGAIVEDPHRRAALHARRAELLEEKLEDAPRARDEWELVLALDPHHVPAQRALGRLHARGGRFEDLLALMRREAEGAPTPASSAAILVRAGAIAARSAGLEEQAIALYREALTLAPADLSALESLAGIYRRRGDIEPLIEVLRARAASTSVPEVKAASLLEAARLFEERLQDLPQAVAAYEEALAADPGQAAARAALERIHACAGRRDALRALRANPSGPASPEQLAHRVAMELGDGGDAAAARDAAQAIARARAAGAPAILALAGGLPAHARAQVRTVLSEGVGVPGEIAVILLSAAAEQKPGAARDAILARAAAIAPDRPSLAPHVEDIVRHVDHAAVAARFQASGAREPVPSHRAHWFVRAGEAWERAGNDSAALTAYRGALAVAPDHLPALRAARALFARQGDWAAVRGTLQAEGTARRDAAGSAAAWMQAGSIAEERFADADAAARDYRTAADRDPSDPEPVLRLEAVAAGRSSTELLELKRSRAASEPDPERAAAGWLDVARLASVMGNDAGNVLEALDSALSLQPGLAPALLMRAKLRSSVGRIAEATADYEACIVRTAEDAARLPLHLAAAALIQDSGGEPARTRAHLEAALRIEPDGVESLGRLARLHFDTQDLAGAADALRRLSALSSLSAAERAEHLIGLAPVEAARGDLAAAVDACRRALEAHPGDPRALRLLAEFEERRGNHSGLAAALETAAETAPDHAARLQARIALARVYRDLLGDPARAIAQVSAALTAAPDRDDARLMLAELLETQRSPLAVQEHLVLIGRSPARVDSWTALHRIFAGTGARDRAYVAAGVLSWLGAPLHEAAPLLAEGMRRPLPALPVLAESDWELLRHPRERGPLADLIAAAGPAISAVLCPPQGEAEPPTAPPPQLRESAAELANALGIERFEIRPGPSGRVASLAGDQPALLVGPDVTRRANFVETRFLLGRALARIRLQAHLVEAIQADQLELALSAMVRLVVPGYAALGRPPDDLARRLAREVTRRVRRAIESPAREVAALPSPPDLSAWRAAAALTADQAGALLCGDLPTALTLLVDEGALGGAQLPAPRRAAAALERSDVAELLAFAASEEHFALRRRFGVALP